ncbi:unnamed protein product [Urochloa decumbens]|uniref:Uncharacterized protein n=1 Tax=Urochloa decumbens TaxID=240449 RepID=A0ABC9G345_9POAL
MRTMTIPSATMRRLKQAAAAARAAADAARAAAPAPVLRRPAGGDGGAARGPPARVHRPTSPLSGHATAVASVGSNCRAPVRANQAAPPAQASSNSSPGGKRRRATAPPSSGRAARAPPPMPPSAPAAGEGAAPAVAVGDRLLVRTPVTNTLAGQHVVMTIGAVVVSVSAADGDGGYLEVILDGDYPPQDPSSPVRITRDQIVVTTPAAATTNTPAAAVGAAASTTVPAPARLGKKEAGGSATSLRGAERQRGLQNAGFKRSRY